MSNRTSLEPESKGWNSKIASVARVIRHGGRIKSEPPESVIAAKLSIKSHARTTRSINGRREKPVHLCIPQTYGLAWIKWDLYSVTIYPCCIVRCKCDRVTNSSSGLHRSNLSCWIDVVGVR